jgi:hypothetical protein
VEKKAHMPSGFTHTPILLNVVFGLASMVKVAFGEDISFVVVTKMAFILNASPPFASVFPLVPPCISLFVLVLLSERCQMMMSRLFPFGHDHWERLHAFG